LENIRGKDFKQGGLNNPPRTFPVPNNARVWSKTANSIYFPGSSDFFQVLPGGLHSVFPPEIFYPAAPVREKNGRYYPY
jgi:hypothetical protein